MNHTNPVPFVDLMSPHLALEEELLSATRNIIRSASFVGGAAVEEFEKEFATFCGVQYCVGVGSGTDALRFALIAAGVEHGDIVITVPNTFVATVEAIIQAKGTPHFVDVNSETLNMSVEALAEFLESNCDRSFSSGSTIHRKTGRRVRAVLPVHLYGQMCDMDPIEQLAAEWNLIVIEDACQAHGSEYYSEANQDWRKAGSIGKAAAFSFYPGKNLGACGEAGAITTNDAELAQRVRMIRDHGQSKKYYHVIEGYNGRLDTLQAAMLRLKLPYLKEWNEKRREAAETYNKLVKAVDGIHTQSEPDWSRGVYHLYVIVAPDRSRLRDYLAGQGIETGLHYPVPLHCQDAYIHLGYQEGDLPSAEKAASEVLSLPMFPGIRTEQQEQVVAAMMQFQQDRAISHAV